MKLQKRHIASEYRDEDGYWIDLKPGLKAANDPVGCVHGMHEDTRKEAYQVGVLVCDCKECYPRLAMNRAKALDPEY